jgi:hypothetical protein
MPAMRDAVPVLFKLALTAMVVYFVAVAIVWALD